MLYSEFKANILLRAPRTLMGMVGVAKARIRVFFSLFELLKDI